MENNQTDRELDGNRRFEVLDMRGLKLTFWGLLLTAINIRIGGFDIVPDVIGYVMAIIGLSRIERYEENFSRARTIAYILAVLALINIYQPQIQNTTNQYGAVNSTYINVNAGIFGANLFLALLFTLLGFAANIYFVYTLCTGMKNLLNQTGNHTLAGTCDDRWKLILGAEVGLLVSMLLVMVGGTIGIIMTMVFGLLALIALVMFLILINQAARSLDGKERIDF